MLTLLLDLADQVASTAELTGTLLLGKERGKGKGKKKNERQEGRKRKKRKGKMEKKKEKITKNPFDLHY